MTSATDEYVPFWGFAIVVWAVDLGLLIALVAR